MCLKERKDETMYTFVCVCLCVCVCVCVCVCGHVYAFHCNKDLNCETILLCMHVCGHMFMLVNAMKNHNFEAI